MLQDEQIELDAREAYGVCHPGHDWMRLDWSTRASWMLAVLEAPELVPGWRSKMLERVQA